MLKYCIVRDEKAERTARNLAVAFRFSKRLALAELIRRYLEERDNRRAMTKKQRKMLGPRSSVNDWFTDLLFPDTIQDKKGQLSGRAKGKRGKKGRGTEITIVDEEDDQRGNEDLQEERDPRQAAKSQLSYWIALGEPLARMIYLMGSRRSSA
jgi:hypothetical protein